MLANSFTGNSKHMSPAPRYLLTVGITLVALAFATIGMTVVVDPYWVFGSPTVPGWTALKPRAAQRAELAKRHLLARMRPHTLLLGNSRVEIGLDPADSNWPEANRPVFNAALAGHDLSSAIGFLQEAIARGSLRTVIVGVDYQDFLSARAVAMPPKRDQPIDVWPKTWANNWREYVDVTLNLDAILDSLDTLLEQSPVTSATMTRAGFNPLHEYSVIAKREGYYSLFEQKQMEYLAQYRMFREPDFTVPMRNREFRFLAQVIDIAVDHNCKVVLFIDPYHARYLDMLHDLGLWSGFEAWKRALLEVVDQRTAGRGDIVQIFDFSGYNDISTERVPPRGDRSTTMQWYWEPGHFKSALGSRIIARITGQDTSFGYELSDSTINTVLLHIDSRRGESRDTSAFVRRVNASP
jgi:hypothetical protein